jgi:hypothetical protein
VHLDIGEVVEDEGEEELVEAGDGHHREESGRQTHPLELGNVRQVSRMVRLIHGLFHRIALLLQDTVEDAGDGGNRGKGERPPQDQAQHTSLVTVVYVGPDYLAGLRGLRYLDVYPVDSEVVDENVLLYLLEILKQLIPNFLAVEHDNGLFADDLVAGDESHLLLVLLLQLFLLLLQLGINLSHLLAVIVILTH